MKHNPKQDWEPGARARELQYVFPRDAPHERQPKTGLGTKAPQGEVCERDASPAYKRPTPLRHRQWARALSASVTHVDRRSGMRQGPIQLYIRCQQQRLQHRSFKDRTDKLISGCGESPHHQQIFVGLSSGRAERLDLHGQRRSRHGRDKRRKLHHLRVWSTNVVRWPHSTLFLSRIRGLAHQQPERAANWPVPDLCGARVQLLSYHKQRLRAGDDVRCDCLERGAAAAESAAAEPAAAASAATAAKSAISTSAGVSARSHGH